MKKLLSFSLISAAFFCIVSCGSRHNISANIKGQGNTVLVYAMDMDGNEQTDTILMKNGRFAYDIPESMSDPVSVSIILTSDTYPAPDGRNYRPDGKSINLIMPRKDRIAIKGESVADGMIFTVKGSEINSVLAAHHKEFLPFQNKVDSLNIEIEKAFVLPETEENEQHINSLYARRGEYTAKINSARKKYIRENPDSELSALYAARYVQMDSLEHYLSLLTPAATGGFLKPFIENRKQRLAEYQVFMKNRELIIEGADAPSFTLSDRSGNAISLADIKTDYVVLDFWGSWCGYCIAGFPKMKEYYAKYSDKVEFVGIDCRDTHEKWIEALDKYKLPWTHVIDNPDDKTSVKYAVSGYPTKILLGPDRKIISIFLGEVDEFYDKLDALFTTKK